MTATELREMLRRELPALMREDPSLRADLADILGLGRPPEGMERTLWQALAEIATEVRLLAEAQRATDATVRELASTVNDLAAEVKDLAAGQRAIRQELGRLSETVGYGLEDIARTVLPGYLERHLGVSVESLERGFVPLPAGGEEEVDLFGEGRREGTTVVVVGEAKGRIHPREVSDFERKLARLRATIQAEVLPVLFGYVVHPEARRTGKEHGILVVTTYDR